MSLKSNFEYIRDWCNHRFLRRDEKVDVDLSNYYTKNEVDSDLSNYYTKDEVDSNISSATPDISVSMYSSSGSKSYNQTISNNGQFELSRVATSGSYNDLSDKPTIPAAQVQSDWNATSGLAQILNKPTIPAAVTESTVSGWGFTKNTGTYSKPSNGIPKTDLTTDVQTSLGKADTALQSYTETDPTVPAWAKASTKPSYNFSEIGGTVADSQLPDAITDLTVDGTLSGNAFKAIAEHIAKLTSRVEVLEAGVGTVDTLSSTSVDSANGYYINGDKTVLNGAGAPSMVPGFIGQFYVDTTNKKLYVATGNSSSSNWTLLN